MACLVPTSLIACNAGPASLLCGHSLRLLLDRNPDFQLPGLVQALGRLPGRAKVTFQALGAMPGVKDVERRSAYSISTMIDGMAWSVRYEYQASAVALMLSKPMTNKSGREAFSAKTTSDEEQALLDGNIQPCQYCTSVQKKKTKSGEAHMLVLATANGGLLLHSPVKIDRDMKVWLDSLGRVDWLILSSACKTVFIKSAKEAFPNAKVVSSAPEAVKLIKAGVAVDIECPEDVHLFQAALHADFGVVRTDTDTLAKIDMIHRDTGTFCVCDV